MSVSGLRSSVSSDSSISWLSSHSSDSDSDSASIASSPLNDFTGSWEDRQGRLLGERTVWKVDFFYKLAQPELDWYRIGAKECGRGKGDWKEEIEKYCGFEKGFFKKVFEVLGEGDGEEGLEVFQYLADKNLLTVERVGTDKHGKPKNYLMINEKLDQGGFSTFHKGFSRRGTLRAISRLKSSDRSKSSEELNSLMEEGLRNADALRQSSKGQEGLSKKRSMRAISRLMNYEKGVKVAEVGGSNLARIVKKIRKGKITLSKFEWTELCRGVLEGGAVIHAKGFIHRDIKLENAVVMSDEEESPVGVKLIDFDFLTRQGKTRGCSGTPRCISPEMMRACLANDTESFCPSTKDDVWAVMYMICEMGASIQDPSERFLSQGMVDRFEEYEDSLVLLKQKASFYYERYCNVIGSRQNLFEGVPLMTSMDKIVFSMAYINRDKRAEFKDVLKFFEGLNPWFFVFFSDAGLESQQLNEMVLKTLQKGEGKEDILSVEIEDEGQICKVTKYNRTEEAKTQCQIIRDGKSMSTGKNQYQFQHSKIA